MVVTGARLSPSLDARRRRACSPSRVGVGSVTRPHRSRVWCSMGSSGVGSSSVLSHHSELVEVERTARRPDHRPSSVRPMSFTPAAHRNSNEARRRALHDRATTFAARPSSRAPGRHAVNRRSPSSRWPRVHWEMVVTRQRAAARLTVRGPETKATTVPIPQDAEFFGIEFSFGTYMPSLPPRQLVDRSLTLPQVTSTSFWLDGSAWELPGPGNADVFADRLVRAGLLVHDPVASELCRAMSRSVHTLGPTTSVAGHRVDPRRHQADPTGGGAVALLAGGMSAADVARRAGYADQPHLTRSLRRLVGQTPSQIVTHAAGEPPSLSFKTAARPLAARHCGSSGLHACAHAARTKGPTHAAADQLHLHHARRRHRGTSSVAPVEGRHLR